MGHLESVNSVCAKAKWQDSLNQSWLSHGDGWSSREIPSREIP